MTFAVFVVAVLSLPQGERWDNENQRFVEDDDTMSVGRTHCIGRWSKWGQCSQTCGGLGTTFRVYNHHQVHADFDSSRWDSSCKYPNGHMQDQACNRDVQCPKSGDDDDQDNDEFGAVDVNKVIQSHKRFRSGVKSMLSKRRHVRLHHPSQQNHHDDDQYNMMHGKVSFPTDNDGYGIPTPAPTYATPSPTSSHQKALSWLARKYGRSSAPTTSPTKTPTEASKSSADDDYDRLMETELFSSSKKTGTVSGIKPGGGTHGDDDAGWGQDQPASAPRLAQQLFGAGDDKFTLHPTQFPTPWPTKEPRYPTPQLFPTPPPTVPPTSSACGIFAQRIDEKCRSYRGQADECISNCLNLVRDATTDEEVAACPEWTRQHLQGFCWPKDCSPVIDHYCGHTVGRVFIGYDKGTDKQTKYYNACDACMNHFMWKTPPVKNFKCWKAKLRMGFCDNPSALKLLRFQLFDDNAQLSEWKQGRSVNALATRQHP